MANDPFTSRLSDYLDDEVAGDERRTIDAHLANCPECRTVLEDLREVVARAAALEDTEPPHVLWPGIAARMSAPPARSAGRRLRDFVSARRFSFTLPQLTAAGLAIMILSGGVVWMARSGDPRVDFEPLSAEATRTSAPAAVPVDLSTAPYDAAVTDLEGALQAGRTRLDPATVRILEENLASIDRAIDQSRRALAADPANLYLNRHLAAARHRKLALLRRASALATAGG
jgi:anti-sigma factor RsiW